MDYVEVIVSVLLVIYTLSPLVRMNAKLMFVYLAILVYTGFFGLVPPESLHIVGLLNKDNTAAILLVISLFIFLFDRRALSVVKGRVKYSEYSHLFVYMWVFVFVSIVSYVMTVSDGYDAIYSIKTGFYFIQYSLLLVLYLILLSLSKAKFLWLVSVLEKMVFLNMVIYVLNNFGVSLLGAKNYMELSYGLVRNFEGFPQLLPFFFSLVYMRFRSKITVWNSSYVFLSVLTVVFSFTRSWVIAFLLIIVFLEVFVIRRINLKSIVQVVISSLSISVVLFLFFPNVMNIIIERFSLVTGLTDFVEVQNISIRWVIFQDRLELLYQNPYFGVGFINTFDPNNYYQDTVGQSVVNGDIFWPNLFVTTGLIGTAWFCMFQIEVIKVLLKRLDEPVVISTVSMLIFLMVISFFSGASFFNYAFSFLLILSFGLVARRHELIEHRGN